MRALGRTNAAEARTDAGAERARLGDAPTWVYPATSRYADVPIVVDGEQRCLARRLLPAVDRGADAGEDALRHRVVAGDRLDTIAGAALGSAELWWRIADQNAAVDPVDLTAELGRMLRVSGASGSVAIAGISLAAEGASDG